ncbi:MAG TPA: PilZ domain-containing protein [Acidimicrobiales bacterium]|nr:PilZ domain-containing protein [Acidimicrobiales bacterium]
METHWTPGVGQIVLLEVLGLAEAPVLTGVVGSDGPGPILIDLGGSPPLPTERAEVVATFYTPDAVYLGRGAAVRLDEGNLAELDLSAMQSVQRRSTPRVRGAFPVALGAFDGADDYVSVAGETVDVSPGGCRVIVTAPLPAGVDPTVCIQLDEPVVALAHILEDHQEGTRWEYRLAFAEIEEPDRRRLSRLVV